MTKNYSKSKGRSNTGSFLALPHALLNHPKYLSLSLIARALLVDIASQYKGKNNGDLCASPGIMIPRGWAKSTLERKTYELTNAGFLQKTRQGGRCNKCNLYAITWQSIDDCNGKLDITSTTTPNHLWKEH